MEVIVDGQNNYQVNIDSEDVFEAIGALTEELRSAGRSLMSMELDGENIYPEGLNEKTKGKPLSSVSKIVITTEETETLIRTCLQELEDVLPNLPVACQELALLFQSENPESGYEPLQQLVTIWDVVKKREIMVANSLDISFEDVEIDGEKVDDMHKELNRLLQEAFNALKSGDSVLLGDLFEYELAPHAEFDARIVALLKERVSTQGQ